MEELIERERYKEGPSYDIVGRKVDTYTYYGRTQEDKLKIVKTELYTMPHVTVNGIEKLQAYFDSDMENFVKIRIRKK